MPPDPHRRGPLRVAVVGGGLAGMAAAARLAKLGHVVRLYEARAQPGGYWAAHPDPTLGGIGVDDAPGVIGFPAPWRDLFRKSGRALEAELARSGQVLAPAPAPTYVFADGSALVLPSERGDQHEALTRTLGPGAAGRWQLLLDSLAGVWQALRPLGLEEAYEGRRLDRETRRRLRSRLSLAELADTLDDPRLRALVRSVAHRQGTTPAQAPALTASDLVTARTFGRWQVAPADGSDTTGDVGRSSALVDVLAARLALRKVEVRTRTEVLDVLGGPTGPTGVRTAGGDEPADAVVLAVDPWTAAALAPAAAARSIRKSLRGATPALAPRVTHRLVEPTVGVAGVLVSERIRLDADGVPVVTAVRRLGGHLVETVHDHGRPLPRPGAGVSTRGFRAWSRRPGTATGVPGVVLAGAASPAGPGASAVLQSGALAAYALAGRRD